ncbi:MAG: helix-turn-helix transcriptional regulator [Lachnospiraceae bacterium]|nr:helix-turn-helix transcriptional regulator [Lachnospiraceae bacterium]
MTENERKEKEEERKEIGEKIRYFREVEHLTQDKLAELAGISPTYMCEIETGKKAAGRDAMRSIAIALGVSLDYLLIPGTPREDPRLVKWKRMLEDCADDEENLLFDITKSMKSTLRNHYHTKRRP